MCPSQTVRATPLLRISSAGNVEEIAVPDDDVRELAALEAAENIFLADLVCAAVGVGVRARPTE